MTDRTDDEDTAGADAVDDDGATGADAAGGDNRNGRDGGGPRDAGEWVRRERSFRGISRRLAVRYLSNLGGDPAGTADDRVDGDDWTATLSEDTVSVGPSLTLTEVTVAFEGDPEALDGLIEAFAQKAMRAGG